MKRVKTRRGAAGAGGPRHGVRFMPRRALRTGAVPMTWCGERKRTSAAPMTKPLKLQPRRHAIPIGWGHVDWPSAFSAVIYPALGVAGVSGVIAVGAFTDLVTLNWAYLVGGLVVGGITLFLCNQGIGGLHRIWQHRAGEASIPAQTFIAFNCLLAMQGKLKDWVNYHSLHHRLSDGPGDPHNPAEGKAWAWVGWILFRDPKDLERPMPLWLRDQAVAVLHDRFHISLSLLIHLIVPAAVYLIVWLTGGSLVLAFFLHACAVVGRAIQFHATTLGVNVLGHVETPGWLDVVVALLTGGEGLHDHHHEEPKSVLHLPRKGVLNRVIDYNGTMILVMQKLGWAKNLTIAPRFA